MERAISFLGLLVLMGIAWVFSTDRRAIKPRTVAWGVGLQVLFAVIILKEGTASFLGMFVFVFLVVLFIGEEELVRRGLSPWTAAAAALGASAVAVAAAFAAASVPVVGAPAIGGLVALAALVVLAAVRLRRPHLARGAFAATLLLGLGLMWQLDVDGRTAFLATSEKVAQFLGYASAGAEFLFGNLARGEYFGAPEGGFWPGFGFQFAFSVLPTIIFFSAFMSILYYLGIVQVVISAMARFMRWSMGTSGSETVSCSANVFVGQTEAPFLVKPFLSGMTVSELHAVMVGGFATVAGGVLAGYIAFGVDAGHLIAASVMSAPAALVMAKILFPEKEHSATAGDVEIPEVETADNVVGAAAAGTTDGLQLALNVAAMLIAFIALIAMVDGILGFADRWIDGVWLGGLADPLTGEFRGVFPGSLRTAFGTLLAPLAWVMGVPWADARAVGNLLGVKLAVNEFVAYGFLAEHIRVADLSPRAVLIATYALCGFANFSSIGIQIGGIGVLAPERRRDLARIGVRAMFGGALASWMTATVAGILYEAPAPTLPTI